MTYSPELRKTRLIQRQKILRAIRHDLEDQGFLEVETPLLVKSTCPDAHIDSVQVGDSYLVTSTEYQIKRLMVEGFDKVFTLSKNFRANDVGRYHSSEFSMLEWARKGCTLCTIEEDASRLIESACKVVQKSFTLPYNRMSVREAFKLYLGLDALEDFSLEPLLRGAKKAQVELPPDFQHDKEYLMSYLLDQLQCHLGKDRPVFLHDWPAFLTASAPLCEHDPYVAERSELYIDGIEIANGFPFLRDAKVQKELFVKELKKREHLGKAKVNIDEKYLQALEQGLAPGAGMALGVDRLVMVLTGAFCLADVQAFTWQEL